MQFSRQISMFRNALLCGVMPRSFIHSLLTFRNTLMPLSSGYNSNAPRIRVAGTDNWETGTWATSDPKWRQ